MTFGQKVVDEAVKRIATIYHTDHMYKRTSPKEILDNRQRSVKQNKKDKTITNMQTKGIYDVYGRTSKGYC